METWDWICLARDYFTKLGNNHLMEPEVADHFTAVAFDIQQCINDNNIIEAIRIITKNYKRRDYGRD